MAKLRDFILQNGEEIRNPVGYSNGYRITNFGRVVSLPKPLSKNKRNRTVELYPSKDKRGYLCVKLISDNGEVHIEMVHRLVCWAFHPNPDNLPQVNHKDGNKTNNHYLNLEWMTNSENIAHAIRNGLINNVAENSGRALINNQTALNIYNAAGTQKEISDKFNVPRYIVSQIKNGVNWSSITGKEYVQKRVRLTNVQILDIYQSSMSYISISKKYGITQEHVRRIKQGKFHSKITNK